MALVRYSLIQDTNPAITKLVLRAIKAPSPTLVQRVRELESSSSFPELRQLARQKLQNFN